MKTMRFVLWMACCVVLAAMPVRAQETDQLQGDVIIFGSGDDTIPASDVGEINVGGLVVVKITDQGSGPVEDVVPEVGREFRHLGNLRGVGRRDGKPLMGGGYTVCLFQAMNEAESTQIKVNYKTPQHVGGKAESVVYKVKIVPQEAE